MLHLSRNAGESIRVGDDIKVVVLGVDNGQVRLGILAPREVTVHRAEIYHRIKAAETKALTTA